MTFTPPPARIYRRKIKVMYHGGPGEGKSFIACSSPGPRFVLDFDNGCGYYVKPHTPDCLLGIQSQHCNCGGDYHLATLDSDRVIAALEWVIADGGKRINSLIIDPVTVWQRVLEEALGPPLEEKTEYQHWRKIKRPLNYYMPKLMNLDVNLVLVARQRETEMKKSAAGRSEVIVVDKPHSWAEGVYAVDVVVRMERVGSKGSAKFRATIDKNRLPGLKSGQQFESGFRGEEPLTFDRIFGPALAAMPEGPVAQIEESGGDGVATAGAALHGEMDEVLRAFDGAVRTSSMESLREAWTRSEELRAKLTPEEVKVLTDAKEEAKTLLSRK